jgi:hypothetical protein
VPLRAKQAPTVGCRAAENERLQLTRRRRVRQNGTFAKSGILCNSRVRPPLVGLHPQIPLVVRKSHLWCGNPTCGAEIPLVFPLDVPARPNRVP